MNLRDFKYLMALDKYRHFGRAAEACFVSQPTLSGQIKKLEEQLGVQLLERSHKQVVVTEVGRQIVVRAKLMLAELVAIEELARAAGDPLVGPLRIGVIPTLGPYFLGYLLPVLRRLYPNLKPILVEEQTARVTQQLRVGDIDVVILATPVHEVEGFVVTPVFFEPFYLAMASGHRLAGRKTVTEQDLQNETLLLLEDGHCLRQHALAFCSLPTSEEGERFRATSLETLRHMVAVGAGVSLFPALAAEGAFAASGGLAYRPFQPMGPGREISVVWRPNAARERACQGIIDAIRQCGLPKTWFKGRHKPN